MGNEVEEIKAIIESVSDIPKYQIDEKSSMIDDLDLSSLEILSIISEIEAKYSIKLSEEEMLSISTVNDLASIIKDKEK